MNIFGINLKKVNILYFLIKTTSGLPISIIT